MDVVKYAREWQASWNSHDLQRIMAHYSDDIRFRSRKAASLVGTGLIVGKPALEEYWAAALQRQPNLRFSIERVYSGHDTMVIAYTNQVGVHAAETLRFGRGGLVVEASACHSD